MVEAYCVKCKKKGQTMKEAKMTKTSKGGFMAKGKCPDCGCGMCAMMSKDKAEAAVNSGEAEKAY
jgi:predicted nucleic acid binding AN1-type Zn finger protein